MADKETREYGAKIGNDYWSTNGVRMELGHSINGSGPHAFGGAEEWPCLRIEIGFEVGQEKRMALVAGWITQLLRAEGVICSLRQAVLDETPTPPQSNRCCSCGRSIIYGRICYKCLENDDTICALDSYPS